MRLVTCTAIAAAMILALPGCDRQAASGNEAEATVETASLDGLTGTWKADVATVKWEGKPDEFKIQDGTYSCATCIPPLTTPADGQFHPVADRPYYDSLSIKVVDDRTVDFQRRKGDQDVGSSNWKLSDDGNALAIKWVDKTTTPASEGTTNLKRAAAAPAGAHGVSGQWNPDKIEFLTEDALKTAYAVTGNTVKMNRLSETYTAELGGPAVTIEGDPGKTTVAVSREGSNGLRETFSRDGKEVGVTTTVPSADGKSVTITNTDPRDGSKFSYTSNKEG